MRQYLVLGFFLMLILSGCLSRPLLYDVKVAPEVISPNADGSDDVTKISYSVGRPCNLSIHFLDELGNAHYFREAVSRYPGDYEVLFGGVIDGKMLPDGTYTYVIEATDSTTARVEEAQGQLVITGADTSAPELLNFTVFPESFTPNRDGIGDRVGINFRLSEAAEVEVYLQDSQGDHYPVGLPRFLVEEEEINPFSGPQKVALEPGIIQYDYDGGIDQGMAPPPNGIYTVMAVAIDAAGNEAVVTAPLTIEDGGVPVAEVKYVEFWPKIVPLGGILNFTATVENTGAVAIRTGGPPPGTTYLSSQNFNVLGYYESDGAFRIGVDFEGNSSGRRYPYRWQLGSEDELEQRVVDGKPYLYLPPGKKVTVTGQILIDEEPPRTGPHFWLGLIHEGVRIVNDYQNPTSISIGF